MHAVLVASLYQHILNKTVRSWTILSNPPPLLTFHPGGSPQQLVIHYTNSPSATVVVTYFKLSFGDQIWASSHLIYHLLLICTAKICCRNHLLHVLERSTRVNLWRDSIVITSILGSVPDANTYRPSCTCLASLVQQQDDKRPCLYVAASDANVTGSTTNGRLMHSDWLSSAYDA